MVRIEKMSGREYPNGGKKRKVIVYMRVGNAEQLTNGGCKPEKSNGR